ncbi:AAA family ATPase [Salinicoccus roseus]|uniref:AAA family ATPase n=1 Tax=Salinicoccus roseus TaxID=45670 RepID=UPI002301A87F|nr:AAA family ATPase [Salinicoccus roseus]
MDISLKVYGLLGKFNYEVDISNSKGIIIIGENGRGKTALLTLIYGVLNNVGSLIYRTKFELITVKIDDCEFSIKQGVFKEYYKYIENNSRLIRRFIFEEVLPNEDLEEHFSNLKKNERRVRDRRPSLINEQLILSDELLMEEYINYISSIISDDNELENINGDLIKQLQNISQLVKRNKIKVLFLPVSRVVESKNVLNKSNLNSLESIEQVIDENLNKYLMELNKANQAIYTNLFDYLLSNEREDRDDSSEKRNKVNINDILDKLSDLESIATNKSRLKKIVNSEKDRERKNIIIDFLVNMDKEFDSKLKKIENKFIRLSKEANLFLKNSGKKFIFNKNDVKFTLIDEKNNEINLTELSSGESHLIKILCELYLLTDEEDILVIIDEPELSLSIRWQEMLMNSIMNSPNYYSMIAATHSPFILGEEKNHINMLKSIDNLVIQNEY